MRTIRPSFSVQLAAIALTATGCGTAEFAPVSGVITLAGEPVRDATVTFEPVEGKGFSYATTDESGRYRLTVAGKPDQDGAAIGEHRVKVTAIAESSSGIQDDAGFDSITQMGQSTQIRYVVPPKYDDFGTSGLSFVVTSSGSDAADFALEK